jgi:hypothetical protein
MLKNTGRNRFIGVAPFAKAVPTILTPVLYPSGLKWGMSNLDKDIATILKPYLYSNLKFRRAVSLRKLKGFIEVETKDLQKIDSPTLGYLVAVTSKLRINWQVVNTHLIRLLHEDEDAEMQNTVLKQKKPEVSV